MLNLHKYIAMAQTNGCRTVPETKTVAGLNDPLYGRKMRKFYQSDRLGRAGDGKRRSAADILQKLIKYAYFSLTEQKAYAIIFSLVGCTCSGKERTMLFLAHAHALSIDALALTGAAIAAMVGVLIVPVIIPVVGIIIRGSALQKRAG